MARRIGSEALSAVALLACAAGCSGGGDAEAPPAPPPAAGPALFADAAEDTGLVFRHFSGATGQFLFAEILGAGVGLLDYDNDGDLDVYLVQGNSLDPRTSADDALFPLPPGQPAGSRLYRNELVPAGALRFVDVTDAAGVGLDAHGMGVATGDIDNDGDVDMYVTTYARNVLYRNEGDGTFTDITGHAGATLPTWSTSASFLDYDRDGDLDLFVTSYVAWSLKNDQRCTSASGNRDYCGPQNYTNLRDNLLRNEGDGRFVNVSEATGIAGMHGPGLGVVGADFDGDGWTDIFVANDGEANQVWMNREGRRFEELGLMSGTAYNRDGSLEASMGVTAGDFDGDGDEDLFMTHLVNETNTLYVNDGGGAFTDSTDRAGLGAASKAYTGFGSAFFDYDNDGGLDLYVVNGDVKIEQFTASGDYAFDQPNQLFRNLGGGRFREVGPEGGAATLPSAISRGAAFGDIDNDGDTDIVVSNNSGPARLLLNLSGNARPSLRLRLVGTRSNRDAYGARVAILRDGRPPLWRRVHSDGSYLSASDPRLVIGLGDEPEVRAVGVLWPSGLRERFAVPATADRLELTEGDGADWPE